MGSRRNVDINSGSLRSVGILPCHPNAPIALLLSVWVLVMAHSLPHHLCAVSVEALALLDLVESDSSKLFLGHVFIWE